MRKTADRLTNEGNAAGAVSCLQAVAELCDDAESYFDLGYALMRLECYGEALPCFEKAVAMRGCNEDIASLGACRIAVERREGKLALERGHAALERGDLVAAVGHFRLAVSRDGSAEHNHWLGRTLAQMGRLDDALPFFEQAARTRGDENDNRWLGEVRTQLVKRQRQAADANTRREKIRVENRPSVQPATNGQAFSFGRLGPLRIAWVVLSAAASTGAWAVAVLAAATGSAVLPRLLLAAMLQAMSVALAFFVARSVSPRNRGQSA